MRTTMSFVLFAASLIFSICAQPAQAQRARVFVASYGSDSNPCTFGSPCKTFQAAVNAVATGGEVTAIDSAGFQPINITKSVTITSPAGIEAGIAPASGGSGIIVNAPNAVVILRGLTVNGGGTTAFAGISIIAATEVDIIDSVIENFDAVTCCVEIGISILTPANTNVVIANSYIANNMYGICATECGGSIDESGQLGSPGGIMSVTLDHDTVTGNANGALFGEDAASVYATVTNSEISNNSNVGISAGGNAALTYLTVTNVNLSTNGYSSGSGVGGAIDVGTNTRFYLSHVNDPYSPAPNGLLAGGNNVLGYSDGTNHLFVTGITLGAWSSQ